MRCFSGVSLALGVSGVSTRTHLNENFDGTRGRPPATRVEAWTGAGQLVRGAYPLPPRAAAAAICLSPSTLFTAARAVTGGPTGSQSPKRIPQDR